jgi:hypothetical protein
MTDSTKPKSKLYSDAEVTQILNDVLDPDKILLVCSKHQYVAGDKPPAPIGCRDCWQAYWTHKIATTPPHLRRERLEQAYRAVYDAVKMHERGKFDFEPFDHIQDVEIKKDAEPD